MRFKICLDLESWVVSHARKLQNKGNLKSVVDLTPSVNLFLLFVLVALLLSAAAAAYWKSMDFLLLSSCSGGGGMNSQLASSAAAAAAQYFRDEHRDAAAGHVVRCDAHTSADGCKGFCPFLCWLLFE